MNKSLPILEYREEIIATVKSHSVLIIKAETGAGKSTQVPQFLLECASKVIVTQPRRLTAMSIAQWVAQEMDSTLGTIVGYRTALEHLDSPATQLLFCTDGLELVREILGQRMPEGVLVIDEVHEWNTNIELLVAWVRYQLQRGVPYKLVLMSATVEAELLANYFGGAAIIEVPGRTFPITERRSKKGVVGDTVALLRDGHNVLVFQPGKADIKRTISELVEMDLNTEILPLHAEMSYEEQQACFKSYSRPKCIVATNVAQTSITIPDIDAVVDSGLERRAEYVDGVEGLYIRPISLADREQRKGRAGRTKPGIYIDVCPADPAKRTARPEVDITRLPVDKMLLQLAHMGIDMEELVFFHQPATERLKQARDLLFCLGCVDRWGALTPTGHTIASLPVSTRWGRMLVEAKKRRVLPDVITLVSIMMHGGVTNAKKRGWKPRGSSGSWSDVFSQLAAFESARKMPLEKLEAYGVDPRSFADVIETKRRLSTLSWVEVKHTKSTGRVEDVVCSVYAGFTDCLYKKSVVHGYKDKEGNCRDLPEGSVVVGAKWVVGLPWNLQVKTDFGPKTLELLTMATRVDQAMLLEVAPHLVAVKEKPGSQEKGDRRVRPMQIFFNDVLLAEELKRV